MKIQKILIIFTITFFLTSISAQTNIDKKIDRYLSAIEAFGFSGSIIVSKGDEVILKKGYGLSNREKRIKYNYETIQSCGSITKQFTAAAILLLESQGKLSVNDKIDKYFEDVPQDKADITIHQLLTHTAGMPGGIGNDEEPIDKNDYMNKIFIEDIQFKPGTDYSYSNAGYTLLGIIIEKVSEKNYETFLRKELFIPADMKMTGYLQPDWASNSLAEGYKKGKQWGKVYKNGWIEDGPGWHLRANGGIHTNVEDMYKWFSNTLRNNVILDSQIVNRWTNPYIKEGYGNSDYAYGWVIEDSNWGKMITHDGSNSIFAATFVWLPEKDFFFYLHGNNASMPAYKFRNDIISAAFDNDFLMPPLVEVYSEAKPSSAKHLEGKYQLKNGSIEITSDDIILEAKLKGQKVINILNDLSEDNELKIARINTQTLKILKRLKEGREDAFEGITSEKTDAVNTSRNFLNRIKQIGNLKELHLIGTFENAPGSNFADLGAYTTFVYAEFEYWNQYWNFIWTEDEKYLYNYSGPWPSLILIPTNEGKFTAVQSVAPWKTIKLQFEKDCLLIGELEVCK